MNNKPFINFHTMSSRYKTEQTTRLSTASYLWDGVKIITESKQRPYLNGLNGKCLKDFTVSQYSILQDLMLLSKKKLWKMSHNKHHIQLFTWDITFSFKASSFTMTSTSPIELSMDMNFLARDILKIYSGIGSKLNLDKWLCIT